MTDTTGSLRVRVGFGKKVHAGAVTTYDRNGHTYKTWWALCGAGSSRSIFHPTDDRVTCEKCPTTARPVCGYTREGYGECQKATHEDQNHVDQDGRVFHTFGVQP